MNRLTRGGTAREEETVDVFGGGKRLPHLPVALNEIDHTRRKATRFPKFYNPLAYRGRQLAGFEDHRIAGQQRRYDVAVGKVARQVERAKYSDDSVRFEAGHARRLTERDGPSPATFGESLDGNPDLLRHRPDFAPRLP